MHIPSWSWFSIVPGDFAGLTGLTRLSIPNSEKLTTVPANAFSELADLSGFATMELKRTNIATIDPDTFKGLERPHRTVHVVQA